MRTQNVGPKKGVGEIDRRTGGDRTNQKLDKGDSPLLACSKFQRRSTTTAGYGSCWLSM
jgi:hypothetical protein